MNSEDSRKPLVFRRINQFSAFLSMERKVFKNKSNSIESDRRYHDASVYKLPVNKPDSWVRGFVYGECVASQRPAQRAGGQRCASAARAQVRRRPEPGPALRPLLAASVPYTQSIGATPTYTPAVRTLNLTAHLILSTNCLKALIKRYPCWETCAGYEVSLFWIAISHVDDV